MAATALGRYELLRLLGRGGMADIYLARRRVAGLEKRLVIKRVRPEKTGDTTFLELFVREARLSMTLSHQNIVPVFDFGRVGDDAFLAMEYIEGRDLGATLARAAAPPSPLLAAFIAAECCQALDHAHRRCDPDGAPLGVVHRDVTPRNVLLSWAGEVKLTDFGVAALAGDVGGDVRGTIAFMAPEQASYEPTDARTDLYALGLVLWQMVAGQRVRRAASREELLAMARSGALPSLPDGPPALIEVIARATHRDPDARFADAVEMHAALDRYLVEARAATPGPTPARQLADWLLEVWGDDAGRVGEPLDAAERAVAGVDLDPATMRSLAETAMAPPEAPAAPAAPEAPAVEPSAPPPDEPRPAAAVPPTRDRRRQFAPAIALVLAAAAVAGWLALRASSPRQSAVADAGLLAAGDLDGAAALEPPDGPGGSADAGTDGAREAADVGSWLDAASPSPPDAASRPLLDAGARHLDPDAAPVLDAAPAAAPALRKVTIGATPWADFTVDDDPTPHQTPETVELTPGRHRIHFVNDRLGVRRTVTIEVPVDRDLRHVEPLEPPAPSP